MTYKLPPLNSLRAFEATARKLNVTEAADELCVTQGAISHQLKKIEEFFNFPLFYRDGKNLSLTKEGVSLAKATNEAFKNISIITNALICPQ